MYLLAGDPSPALSPAAHEHARSNLLDAWAGKTIAVVLSLLICIYMLSLLICIYIERERAAEKEGGGESQTGSDGYVNIYIYIYR